MNGFAQLLLEHLRGKARRPGRGLAPHEIIENALKELGASSALLSLARVTRAALRRERVDLGELARCIVAQLAAESPERRVELVVHDGDLAVEIDPPLARALLANLLGNAWKFTGKTERARIELGATAESGVRAFFVRDNGAGFDMAFANKLFAPFQRLHSTSEFPGTGIGLATVQRIVHRHGGRVWAEGVSGGATFHFTLESGTDEAGDAVSTILLSWKTTRATRSSRCSRSAGAACRTTSPWRATASKRSTTCSARGSTPGVPRARSPPSSCST